MLYQMTYVNNLITFVIRFCKLLCYRFRTQFLFSFFVTIAYFRAIFIRLMKMIPEIKIDDYDYPLPEERIAKYPLERRDASRLLEYRDGAVSEHVFSDIPDMQGFISNVLREHASRYSALSRWSRASTTSYLPPSRLAGGDALSGT